MAVQSAKGRLRRVGEVVARPLYPPARLLNGNLLGLQEALKDARAELEAVKAEAKRERLALEQEFAAAREELAREVEDQRRAGYAEGCIQGREELVEMMRQFQMAAERQYEKWPEQIQRLAFLFARKILGVEFQLRPEALLDYVRSVLDSAKFCRRVTLILHPEAVEVVRPHEPALLKNLIQAEKLEIRVDASLPRYGVVLETDRGIFDGNCENALRRLEDFWFGGNGQPRMEQERLP